MPPYNVLRFPLSEDPSGFVIIQATSSGSRPLDVKLVATEGEEPYVAKLQDSQITKLKAENSPCSTQEWRSILEALFQQESPKDIQTVATVNPGTSIDLTIRKSVQGITQRLGVVTLKYTDHVIELFDWCSEAVQATVETKRDLSSSRDKIQELERNVQELKAQLDELIAAKQADETVLLEKFCNLLNEKKAKIRDQHKLLSASPVPVPNPRQASAEPLPNPPSPPATKKSSRAPAKTKAKSTATAAAAAAPATKRKPAASRPTKRKTRAAAAATVADDDDDDDDDHEELDDEVNKVKTEEDMDIDGFIDDGHVSDDRRTTDGEGEETASETEEEEEEEAEEHDPAPKTRRSVRSANLPAKTVAAPETRRAGSRSVETEGREASENANVPLPPPRALPFPILGKPKASPAPQPMATEGGDEMDSDDEL